MGIEEDFLEKRLLADVLLLQRKVQWIPSCVAEIMSPNLLRLSISLPLKHILTYILALD